MKIERLDVNKGLLVLNSTDGRLESCRLFETQIVSRVPVLFSQCMIISEEPAQSQPIDKRKPYARVSHCLLIKCKSLTGGFEDNYFKKPS